MKQYPPSQIRNIILLSHSGAGKTSLAEAMLFTTGAITRLGKVETGNTVSDYDPDEIKRKISISLSLLPCEWQNNKINIIDTPGYSDFIGEVKSAIRVCEGAVIVVSARSGIKVGTEQVWKYSQDAGLSRIILSIRWTEKMPTFQGCRANPIQIRQQMCPYTDAYRFIYRLQRYN